MTNPDKPSTGLFAKVADPEDTARALAQFIDDADLRKRCVENAYCMVVERYDWELIAKDMHKKVFLPMFGGGK